MQYFQLALLTICLFGKTSVFSSEIFTWTNQYGQTFYSEKPSEIHDSTKVTLPERQTKGTDKKVRFYPNALSQTHITVNRKYYPVKGVNGAEVYASFRNNAPKPHGKRAGAVTASRIRWSIETQYDSERSLCRVTKAESSLNVTYTYPKWGSRAESSKRMGKAWDRYYAYLQRHEKTHKRIAYRAAKKIADKMANLAPQKTCKLLRTQAKTIYQREYKLSRQQQKAFDRKERKDRHPDSYLP